MRAYSFCPVCLPVSKNFNIGYNFWTVIARALILHMCIPCGKTSYIKVSNLVTFFKILYPFFLNFNIAYMYNFLTADG